MNNQQRGMAALCAALAVAPIVVHAQDGDLGQREYANSCAVCHGERGKGDGPIVPYLKTAPADLTTMQKSNKGVFPFGRVYEIIDGRTAVAAHGTRDMPVWGDRFKQYNSELAELGLKFGTRVDSEAFVRDRILALIRYISGLQEK
jgi:mono/diheme cytochrome c family protein